MRYKNDVSPPSGKPFSRFRRFLISYLLLLISLIEFRDLRNGGQFLGFIALVVGRHVVVLYGLGDQLVLHAAGHQIYEQVGEADDPVLEDHVQHFRGFFVSGVAVLQRLFTVCGQDVLVAGIAHGFRDDPGPFQVSRSNRNGQEQVSAGGYIVFLQVVHLRRKLMIFVYLRWKKTAT